MDSYDQPSATVADASPADTQGRTVISDTAVAKVVGVAVRSVAGVHALGSGASRSLGAIREVVGAADLTQGVRVEVGETQVAVDIILLAEYGYPLQNLADTVRRAVYSAVEELVGRHVIEVNIEITDVFIPTHDAEKPASRPRLTERLGTAVKTPVAADSNNPLETGE
ncbi:Asp23/Gls24 family envelope stress response protein [Arthrobacter psychrolactophilus]|uniref:Asp23/Gls24 family envelope stress response protein n=1 Tax=Arthrobacter psychrolactophilus TaxID=92442 RepID=A0A2V5IVP3_9MICC|nr:Asp23/Gls24 family envelope stress response protein [Arthrobacter psychrolactophilus]PYI40121.1 Asp23/Gls24 family envelope stress response protein [Arthrobacter psychrolactophilus]